MLIVKLSLQEGVIRHVYEALGTRGNGLAVLH
jgi:hypothetical protein